MALPPSSMMRARLRANSSTSTASPCGGSVGALTVASLVPRCGVPAAPRRRLQVDVYHDGRKTGVIAGYCSVNVGFTSMDHLGLVILARYPHRDFEHIN